ncbi:MAG TPA: LacI family DNA-binding transcriptional regulator [Acidimicrobiia bacterium]|nr:LacI family DNA-binding transcriptional regulator [Acidimicrobiia bacterium]
MQLKRFNAGKAMARTTIREVSDRAGVSVGTVSNVLNAPHLVADPTKARVLSVISELDYRPHRAARSLQARRSYLIGYRLPGAGKSPALDVFLHALVGAASGYGLEIALFSPRGDESELDSYRRLISGGDVDGLVLSDTNYRDPRIGLLTDSGFPFVSFGRALDSQSFSWVDVDGAAGMKLVVDHLVAAGHRQITLAAWPEGSESGDERVRGFGRGKDREVIRVLGGFENGRQLGRELFRRDTPPTAVAAVEDSLALGMMAAATELGLKVGSEIAVAGFDDSIAAGLVTPGLTSVRQPMDQVARWMIDALVSMLAGSPVPQSQLLMPDLVVRESTGTA